jgi:hypothetical protein
MLPNASPVPYPLATTRPHARHGTQLECAQFPCLITSWRSYKTSRRPPLLLHPTDIVAPHASLWQTLGPQITCYPTRLPSSTIVRLTSAGLGWAITPLHLFWVQVQLSSLSTANEFLFETASPLPLFATNCTASAPTTANMAVGSSGCITWVLLFSSQHLLWRLTLLLTITFCMNLSGNQGRFQPLTTSN